MRERGNVFVYVCGDQLFYPDPLRSEAGLQKLVYLNSYIDKLLN